MRHFQRCAVAFVAWFVSAAAAPVPSPGVPEPPRRPALHLDDGRLYVNGQELLGPFAVFQARFGYLHFYVPGHGLFTVGAAPFPGAVRAGRFAGATLEVQLDGTTLRVSARDDILTPAEQDAWVLHDPDLNLNVSGALYGYGDTPSVREQWLERFGRGS